MPTPPPSRARTIQRWIVSAVTSRLPVKLAAIFFSLVLWLMVSSEEPTEEWVDVRVVLATDSTVHLSGDIPPVQALVVGRGRELLKLYTIPPVFRRAIGSDTPDSVMLDIRPGDVDLPNNVDARVRDVRPRAIPLRFRVTAQRRVPVRALVAVVPGSGLHLTSGAHVEPESVTIRGPRRLVRAVDSVTTERTTLVLHAPGVEQRTIPLDTARLGVAVRPADVRVAASAARDTVRVAAPPRDSLDRVTRDSAGGESADSGAARPAPADSAPPGPPDSGAPGARRDSTRPAGSRDSTRRPARDSGRDTTPRRASGHSPEP